MVRTKMQVLCDRCEKDITSEYAGTISVLIRDGDTEEIEPEGKTFCKECMLSFTAWMKSGKAVNNGNAL